MISRAVIILLFPIALFAQPSRTNWVDGNDWLAVSNMISTQITGGLVIIGPTDGVKTWSNTVEISRPMWIRGSGTNSTIYTNAPGLKRALTTPNAVNNFTTNGTTILLSDITFEDDQGATHSDALITIGSNVGSGAPFRSFFLLKRVRILGLMSRGFSLGLRDARGVVSECFVATATNALGGFNHYIINGNSWDSWNDAYTNNPQGTTNTVVVENSVFRNPAADYNSLAMGNGYSDGYQGGKGIHRFNFYDGSTLNGQGHGYDSDVNGVISMEVYGNVFTNQNVHASGVFSVRSGTFLVFSNRVYGTYSDIARPGLTYYRQCVGSYQGGRGYPNVLKTNRYGGLVTSADINHLADEARTNVYEWWLPGENNGKLVKIVAGTGAGQERIAATMMVTNLPGRTNLAVSTNWRVTPDATSVYEVNWTEGQSVTIGTWPTYKFVSTLTQNAAQVLLASTLAETISNLVSAINQDTNGSSTRYSSILTNVSNRNDDFVVESFGTNYIVLRNRLDVPGTNYPAALQPGFVGWLRTTNLYAAAPCYEWENWHNNTNNLDFALTYGCDTCVPAHGVQCFNLLQEDRDYFNDTPKPGLSLLPYPHPVIANAFTSWIDDPTVSVSSAPAGASLTVSADLGGTTSVENAATLTYIAGSQVTMTAAATLDNGAPFEKWTLGGADYSTSLAITFTVEPDMDFVAVYSDNAILQESGSAILQESGSGNRILKEFDSEEGFWSGFSEAGFEDDSRSNEGQSRNDHDSTRLPIGDVSGIAPSNQATLSIIRLAGRGGIRIDFTGVLQHAESVAGPWADLANAVSPYWLSPGNTDRSPVASETSFFRTRTTEAPGQ